MEQYYICEENHVIEGKTFSGGCSARDIFPDGKPCHTFRSYALLAEGKNLTFKNCLFENLSGPGRQAGQAIALYLDGDEIRLVDCVLRGYQDTLFLAPLPEKEREPDGFIGPKQHAPRTRRTMYFKNCLIQGGVDFVFGGATAYFDGCEFKSVEPGFVFAPSTPRDVKTGFVARNCRFTAGEGVPDASCYIGRPWRDYGKVRLENCWLGPHIRPEGWDDWGRPQCHDTVEFVEIGSQGPGACPEMRPSYVRMG